ncbi:hypothetical protein [Candidatus Desulforudis audaxviator]|uniref:hypothetical protein n=1 Tax=Candidatus Desulforudis audaxviator TaxID=471827 RepID=UPI0002E21A8A|nr:hypothetical protein [Candidatus Desulforudis audaxviator]AZK60024.1 hypothetical protein Daudx_1477 [Candidatus Desulforudis audaxviator]
MTVNYKETIDNNVAQMIKKYSPEKPASSPVQPAAPAPAANPAITGTRGESFFARLWKSIFKFK